MSLNLSQFAGLNREAAPASTASAGTTAQKRPEAQFWLNFGYVKTYADEQGVEQQTFVSRHGIPLDHIEDFDLSRIRNANMATMRRDQNAFHGMVMAEAHTLEPGQAIMLCYDETTNLGVELRRVGAAAAPIEEDANAPKQFSFRPRS